MVGGGAIAGVINMRPRLATAACDGRSRGILMKPRPAAYDDDGGDDSDVAARKQRTLAEFVNSTNEIGKIFTFRGSCL